MRITVLLNRDKPIRLFHVTLFSYTCKLSEVPALSFHNVVTLRCLTKVCASLREGTDIYRNFRS